MYYFKKKFKTSIISFAPAFSVFAGFDAAYVDIVDTPITNTGAVFANTFSKFGGFSAQFNGASYVSYEGSVSMLGTNDFTVEMWVNPSATQTQSYPVLFGIYSAASKGRLTLFAGHQSYGANKYHIEIEGWTNPIVSSRLDIVRDAWSHIVVVRKGTQIALFVNGELEGAGYLADTFNITTVCEEFTLGAKRSSLSNTYFKGYIDEVRVTNGYARYDMNLTLPTLASHYTEDPYYANNSLLLEFNNNLTDSMGLNTVTESPTPGVPTFSTTAKFGSHSAQFSGLDFFKIPSFPSFGIGNWTIECWVKTTGTPTPPDNHNNIVGCFDARGGQGWNVGSYYNGQQFIFTNRAGVYNSSNTAINDDLWHHIAVVRNGTNILMFVDGILKYTHTSAYTTATDEGQANAPSLYIGSVGFTSPSDSSGFISRRFIGNIDELRISNIARYTSGFTPTTAEFSADASTALLMHFNGNYNDDVGNTVLPSTPLTFVTPKVGTHSAKFHRNNYVTVPGKSFGTSDFSIDFWVNAEKSTDYYTVIAGQLASTSRAGQWALRQRWTNGDNLVFSFRTSTAWVDTGLGNAKNGFPSGIAIADGAWHHITMSRIGAWLLFFIDGKHVWSYAIGTNVFGDAASPIQIGGTVLRDNYNFSLTGQIDQFRITEGVARKVTFPLATTTHITTLGSKSLENVTNKKPVLLMHFNNNATDSAGSLNTYNYGVTFDNSIFKMGTHSALFNGTNSRITIPSNDELVNFSDTSTDFCIEMWVYNLENKTAYTTYNWPTQVTYGSHGTESVNWSFGTNHNGKVVFYYYGLGTNTIIGSTTIPLNTWTHVAMTRANNTIKLWVNGVQDARRVITAEVGVDNTRYPLQLGVCYNVYYHGYIDELRLSRNIGSTYSAKFTPATTEFPSTNSTTYTADPKFDLGAGDWTIECWIYKHGMDNSTIIWTGNGFLATGGHSSYNASSWIAINSGGSAWGGNVTGWGVLSDGIWMHLSACRKGNMIYTHRDGIPVGYTNVGTTAVGPSPSGFTFGSSLIKVSGASVIKGYAKYKEGTAFTLPILYKDPYISYVKSLIHFSGISNYNFVDTVAGTGFQNISDSSGRNISLTMSVPTTISDSSPFNCRGSMVFDANNNRILPANNAAFNMGTGDLTVECWINTGGVNPPGGVIFSTGYYTTNSVGFSVIINAENKLSFISTVGAINALATSPEAVPLNKWIHIAAVRYSSTTSLYIDGVRVASGTDINSYTAAYSGVGGYYAGTAFPFYGSISMLKVSKGAYYTGASFVVPLMPPMRDDNTVLLLNPNRSTELGILGNPNNGLTTVVAGNSGYCNFTVNDGVKLAVGALMPTANDMTMEAWVHIPTAEASKYLFSAGVGFRVYMNSNMAITVALSSQNTSDQAYVSSPTGTITGFSANTWTHIAITRNIATNTWFILVNGIPYVATYNILVLPSALYPSSIGCTYSSATAVAGFFTELNIESFRFTNGINRYSANFTPPTERFPSSVAQDVYGQSVVLLLQANSVGPVPLSIIDSGRYKLIPTTAAAATTCAKVSTDVAKFGSRSFKCLSTNTAVSISNSVLDLGLNDFTIEAWIYPTAWGTYLRKDSGWTLAMSATAVTAAGVTASGVYSLNTWYHIAVVRQVSTIGVFVNGQLAGLINSTVAIAAGNNTVVIGTQSGSCYMDDIRITNGVCRYPINKTAPTRTFSGI